MMRRAFTAILDTNVVLDIYSIGDLAKAYEQSDGNDSPLAHFRRVRARESVLLAWHLHETRAVTLSLPEESVRALTRQVDPSLTKKIEHQHVQLSIYLLKDRVLSGWQDKVLPGSDRGLTNHQGDDKLLELARRFGAPLITNEGYSLEGVSAADAKKLRARAIASRIPVFTPREFWARTMGERACRKFLARFDRVAPKFIRGQGDSRDLARRAVALRRGMLQHIFFGETADGRVLPVRLPG